MALDIKPTRSELINLKRRIKQTRSGYNLLKMKRDGLFHEFRKLLSEMISAREELVASYRIAVEAISLASAIEGGLSVKSAAIANSSSPEVEVSRRNIMGVVVPSIEVSQIQKSVEERGYGLIGTSVRVDEAVHAFEILAAKILEAAELETTMKKLLDEIESTKRRVNALEFKIIPQLEEIASYITLRLEELERENIFRLKRIKG